MRKYAWLNLIAVVTCVIVLLLKIKMHDNGIVAIILLSGMATLNFLIVLRAILKSDKP